mmetsp:Transcript_83415/g.145000  ORF Transcript_83415/g.145000 Transcript_83415/m.145000 type:complete len:80 (+) Transcript_83415:2511-2750(+)
MTKTMPTMYAMNKKAHDISVIFLPSDGSPSLYLGKAGGSLSPQQQEPILACSYPQLPHALWNGTGAYKNTPRDPRKPAL